MLVVTFEPPNIFNDLLKTLKSNAQHHPPFPTQMNKEREMGRERQWVQTDKPNKSRQVNPLTP